MNKSKTLVIALALIASVSGFGKTVTETAPDGVNVITHEVNDETGLVESSRMTLVHVPEKVTLSGDLAATAAAAKARIDAAVAKQPIVYRLELHTVDGVETPYIVGGDEVRRPVVLIDPDEYIMLTGKVEQIWKSLNETPEGRKRLHGKMIHQIIDTDKKQKVEEYEDGYLFRSEFKEKQQPSKMSEMPTAARRRGVSKSPPEPFNPKNMTRKRWKMRQELRRRKEKPVETVTVEHNAATGETKVISQ